MSNTYWVDTTKGAKREGQLKNIELVKTISNKNSLANKKLNKELDFKGQGPAKLMTKGRGWKNTN